MAAWLDRYIRSHGFPLSQQRRVGKLLILALLTQRITHHFVAEWTGGRKVWTLLRRDAACVTCNSR